MSGKAKQANRTKNNVRPSSSGRSAEIISSTVNPALVLVGPGNLLTAAFPSLAGPIAEQPLSNQFLLCFKKFYKKDPITKIKALNELKELVAQSEQDEVVNALGSWAHYYPTLTVDMDRKVREATQTCHGAIVRKCGRKLALHIKRLLPAWLIAQYDEHVPVQRIVRADLDATFPEDKMLKAVKFCNEEICHLLVNNLKGNADYMLSGKKIDDEEERLSQVARVINSTLRAMELLVKTLPDSQEQWLWDTLLPLLCANSYWRLAAHSSPGVRASWYILTRAVIDRFHAQLPPELARRCACSLVAHTEGVASVCVERWRTLIKLLHSIPDSVNHMNNKDLLLKRLWEALENAAWGDTPQMADTLTTLLELVPIEMDIQKFYNKFFMALLTGLCHKTLLFKENERNVWNSIIAKFVRYLSTAHEHEQYTVTLISRSHRAWLDTLLTVPDFPGKTSHIRLTASLMGEIVRFWTKLAEDGKNPLFNDLVINFWSNISYMMTPDLDKQPIDDIVNVGDTHMLFIIALKQFMDSKGNLDASGEVTSDGDRLNQRCLRDLEHATETVVGTIFDFALRHQLARKILPVIMPVLKEFHSPNMLRNLARKLKVESILKLYHSVLKTWLVDDKQRCITVVELVFLLAQSLDVVEQDVIFDSFGELSAEVVQWCLELALSQPYRDVPAVRKWLRSDTADGALAVLLRDEDQYARKLLLAALQLDHSGEVIVSDKTVSGIVSACTEMLTSVIARDPEITLPEETTRGRTKAERRQQLARLEPRVLFSAQVAHALPAAHGACGMPLLLGLFRLTLRLPRDSPLLATEAWTEALWAWREGARRLPPAHHTTFVRDALRHIHWHLFHDLKTLNIQRIDHMVSLCPYFVIPSDGLPPPKDLADLVALSQLVLDIQVEDKAQVPLEVFALQLDVIWGDLNCPFEQDNEWIAAVVAGKTVLTKETLMVHAYKILFRASYVRELLMRAVRTDDEQGAGADTDAARPSWCHALIRVHYFQEQFYNILHDYAVLNVLYDHYAFWDHYDIIRQVKARMDKVLLDVVTEIPADVHDIIATNLEEEAATHGYYCVYAKNHYKRTVLTAQLLSKDSSETLVEKVIDKSTNDFTQEFTLEASVNSKNVNTNAQEYVDAADAEIERADSQQSHSSSSFEVVDVDAVDTYRNDTVVSDNLIDTNVLIDTVDTKASEGMRANSSTVEVPCVRPLPDSNTELSNIDVPCDRPLPDSSTELVFCPLLLENLKTECSKQRKPSRLANATMPPPKLASKCEKAALYVDLLGKMILTNGYYHEAQMKAAEVKKQKLRAKKKFSVLQDTILTNFEINGQYKIFDKWTDDPAAYRQVGVDVDETALYTAKDRAMVRNYYCVYAASAPDVDGFISDIASESAQCNLDAVINGYYRHNGTLLFESKLTEASWLQLNGTAAVMDLLAEAVARGWDAPAPHWDFTNIALCSALTSLALSTCMWPTDTVRLAVMARPTLELFVRVRHFVNGVRAECTRRQPSAHVAALPREWKDIFGPDTTRSILLLVRHVLDGCCPTITAPQAAILHWLTEASIVLEMRALPPKLNLEEVVRAATNALYAACHHGFKYLAYYTLRALAPVMVRADEEKLAARAASPSQPTADDGDDEDEDEDVFSGLTLSLYDEHFEQLQELVDSALSNYVLYDDICEILPHSDSHSVVLGYLLLGVAMHRHCELATGDLAIHYGNIFNTLVYVEGFLPTALRLLPAGVVHYMMARVPTLHKGFMPWFIRLPDLDLNDMCTSLCVSRLACGAVLRALAGPGGAGARGWWGVQRSRDAVALARLVQVAIAPPLINHQLAEVLARARQLGPRAKVSVCWSARSAACVLRGEGTDRPPALRVTLSALHPLHAPRVHNAQPGSDPHWVALYLGYQNGRVFNAMQMWMKAVSAELRDMVPCYVCYCRTHPIDGTVPAVNCFQCRNKFHASCLRRWFKTSHRSNCPVCRTNF